PPKPITPVTPVPIPQPVKKVSVQAPARKAAPPAPTKLVIHRELIPKDVSIVRFNYSQPVHSPGDSFHFNIVGSGFTPAFQQTLSVYAGSAHVQIRNLHLVTINQIEGEFVVLPTAPSQYVFPYVLLNNVPVFQASTPFAVIRPGEVLDIVFTH